MLTSNQATALHNALKTQTATKIIRVEASPILRVGDHVSRQPILDDDEATFYRVKKTDSNAGVFEVDPNSPFERSWKGRIDDFKPHHLYPGYWVPRKVGVNARAELASRASGVKREYEVSVNWHGELLKVVVSASTESQSKTIASHKLAKKQLNAFTQRHIYQYMIANENRVTIKQK